MQKIHKLNHQITYDLLLTKEFSRHSKPFMIISPQITYLRTFMNMYTGVFGRHGSIEFCYDMEVVEDLLIQL